MKVPHVYRHYVNKVCKTKIVVGHDLIFYLVFSIQKANFSVSNETIFKIRNSKHLLFRLDLARLVSPETLANITTCDGRKRNCDFYFTDNLVMEKFTTSKYVVMIIRRGPFIELLLLAQPS